MLRTARSTPYLYIGPAVALLLITFAYPLVAIFNLSVRRVQGLSGEFVGLDNYLLVLNDDVFRKAVAHNGQMLLAVPILLVVSILLAVLLYERLRGWQVYRSIMFFPYVLAVPIIGVVFGNILQLHGSLNMMLRELGLGALALDWIGDTKLALWSIMGIAIWHNAGFGIVLFLARLQSLNEEIVDASKVDGAGWWQRLWYVIVPQLRSVTEFYVVTTVITMIAWVFSYVYVITRGGPANSTQVLEFYIYNSAFRYNLFGSASAVAAMLFLITLVLIVPFFALRGRGEEEAGGVT
jgi:ABC-type sugar transport system permease subunit